MGRKLEFIIEDDFDGKKVISYLKGKVNISSRLLRTLKQIDNGITLNNEHIRTVDTIHKGDVLAIDIPCPQSSIEPIEIPIDIVYEDDDIAVVNKDPFLACHPTHNHQGDTLANALTYHLQQEGKQSVFRAIGRLDKGTSGIVVCALNKHSAAMIPKSIKKEYLAVVSGKVEQSGTIDKPIYRPDPMKTLRAVGDDGDRAVTHWEVIKQNNEMSFVRVRLETGRTHQIRVHFASIGHYLVGDDMYGEDKFKLGHQLLHCEKIEFIHPVLNKKLILEAPMPEDMKKIVDGIK